MLTNVVRPLRLLEGAAEQAGRGEAPCPVDAGGFSEFRQFAGAFNRMDAQIVAQRQALLDVNVGLEAKVRERTLQIEAARERLAEVDRTRRLFVSKVSHELRTPVTVIRGEAEVALRDRAAPAARLRDALEHVVANGHFLQRRLDDMLALARAEDGRLVLNSDRVDLSDVVRGAVALAEPFVRSSGMALRIDLAEGPGPIVTGDASWLQQGLLALLDNAAKFAVGGEEIRVCLVACPPFVRLAVADNGPGVAAADLPYLFESYYQGRSHVSGGSGLGLSVARWVVEQHGGVIAAHSEAGAGLVVEIRLPLA
jgi:signal transduction histidine kinase